MNTLPEQAARLLLEKFGSSLPIDVHFLATASGITVVPHRLDDNVSGVLVVKADTAIIGVNEAHPSVRQRFTVAHELGHWVLHRGTSQVFVDAAPVFFRDGKSSMGTAVQEVQANAFAAELLMPSASLQERIGSLPGDAVDESALRQMAAQYGVSLQALTIRLTKLGLIAG